MDGGTAQEVAQLYSHARSVFVHLESLVGGFLRSTGLLSREDNMFKLNITKALSPCSGAGSLAAGDGEILEDEEDSEEEEAIYVGGQDGGGSTCVVQVCIYSGEHLPACQSYAVLTLEAGNGKVEPLQRVQSIVSPATSEPLWELTASQSFEAGAGEPSVQIQVFNHRAYWRDELLGTATLQLPTDESTRGPRRQVLPLRRPSSAASMQHHWWQKGPEPSISVLWEVVVGDCKAATLTDLVRVAQMGMAGLTARPVNIDVRLSQIRLAPPRRRRGTTSTKAAAAMYTARMSLVEHDGQSVSSSPVRNLGPWSGERFDASWQCDPWVLYESRAMLLKYYLQLEILRAGVQGVGEQEDVFCAWRVPLADLVDEVHEFEKRLTFWAELTSPPRIRPVGGAQLDVDVYFDRPHVEAPQLRRSRADLDLSPCRMLLDPGSPSSAGSAGGFERAGGAVHGSGKLAINRGSPLKDEEERPVTYFCTVLSEGLPVAKSVYVRVSMCQAGLSTFAASTEAKSVGLRQENETTRQMIGEKTVRWPEQLRVAATSANRRACVQVWSENFSHLVGSYVYSQEDELVGQAIIHNVVPNESYWCHFYGGAVPAQRKEVAAQMVCGALRPASTHRGSLCVHFSTTPRPVSPLHTMMLKNNFMTGRLVVRLHRGLYLDAALKGKQVRVCVQRPGGQPVQGSERHGFLSFHGEVDHRGVLRFLHHKGRCAWIESATSAASGAELLHLASGITHVYLYIVVPNALGEASRPRVFGRLRLMRSMLQYAASKAPRPRWRRLRYDASVVEPPHSFYPNSFAGCILGSATWVPMSSTAREAEDPGSDNEEEQAEGTEHIGKGDELEAVGYSCCARCHAAPRADLEQDLRYQLAEDPQGELRPRRLYCHVDVLAARGLPDTREDGLSFPRFSVQVEETVVQCGEVPESFHPTYMQRAVIPIDVDEGHEPYPPLLFKLRHSQGQSGACFLAGSDVGRACEEVATVLVKHPEKLAGGTALEAVNSHKAFWHALDEPEREAFDGGAGGCRMGLQHRPRVLLAVGVSGEGAEAFGLCTFVPLSVDKVAEYRISIDLLGLRSLPKKIAHPTLLVSSSWAGDPVELTLDPRDHNFHSEVHSARRTWHPVSKQHSTGSISVTDSRDTGADEDEGAESAGVRIVAPAYFVPIIPYLQREKPRRLDGARSRLAAPFVLMPDILFRLREHGSQRDLGVISVPVAQLGDAGVEAAEDGFELDISSSARAMDEIAERRSPGGTTAASTAEGTPRADEGGSERRPPRPLEATLQEDAYSIFVDTFAAMAGDLRWDRDLRLGRTIHKQHLFTIDTPDGKSWRHGFNPWDTPSAAHHHSTAEPFEERVTPTLSLEQTSASSSYEAYHTKLARTGTIGSVGRHARAAVEPATSRLRRWRGCLPCQRRQPHRRKRCVSKLVSPERVPQADWLPDLVTQAATVCLPQTASAFLKRRLAMPAIDDQEFNQRTFVRRVGHVIPKDCSEKAGMSDWDARDARYLARLHLSSPKGVSEDQPRHARSSTTLDGEPKPEDIMHGENYLLIKFNKPGTVIWAPPPSASPEELFGPGSVLFVVRLEEDDGRQVPVLFPGFDLRYPFETAWMVRKTLTTRWRDLERHTIKQDLLHRSGGELMAAAGGGAPPPQHRRRGRHGGRAARQQQGSHDPHSDGHSRSVRVAKYAFVCRLLKLTGPSYDRPQTRSWYDHVLAEAFAKELQEAHGEARSVARPLPALDEHKVAREVFEESCMNLKCFLLQGADQSPGALLKGHIRARQVSILAPPSLDRTIEERLEGCMEPKQHHLPAEENLWAKTQVSVHVCIMTASGLKLPSRHGQLYITAEVPGSGAFARLTSQFTSKKFDIIGQGTAAFYHNFHFSIPLPGASILSLTLRHCNSLMDRPIGQLQIDLEDRWLALAQRDRRLRSDVEFLRQNVSPPFTGLQQRAACDAEPEAEASAATPAGLAVTPTERPHLRPPQQTPIECSQLAPPEARPDEFGAQAGQLRLWLGMTEDGQRGGSIDPTAKMENFEIRVTVWDVDGISIFRGFTERNDVCVQGRLHVRDYLHREEERHVETDVHHWANSKATFNYRWVFRVTAPVVFCKLEFTLVDVEYVFHKEHIYCPKELPLDYPLMVALNNSQTGKPSLSPVSRYVYFDTAERETRFFCFSQFFPCFWSRRASGGKVQVKRPARMRVDVQVVPVEHADAFPAEPGQVSQPRGRLTWSAALQDPEAFFTAAIGPQLLQECKLCFCCALCLLITIAVLFLAFLVVNSLHPIVSIRNR